MVELLQILQHSHGLDKFGRGTFYRNHFVTGEASVDHPLCMEAVRLGLMVRHAGNALTSEMDAFTVTDQGRAYIAAQSPKVDRKQRNRDRYNRFLDVRDVMPDLTFRDFLRRQKEFAA